MIPTVLLCYQSVINYLYTSYGYFGGEVDKCKNVLIFLWLHCVINHQLGVYVLLINA